MLSPGCPLAPGRHSWDASAWAQMPGALRGAGPLDGSKEGWVLLSTLLFSEPGVGGASRLQRQLHAAGLGRAHASCA